MKVAFAASREATTHSLLNPHVAESKRRVGIRLDADESGRLPAHLSNTAGHIRIVKHGCPLRSTGLRVRQSHLVMVAGDDDVVLEPDSGS